LVAIWSAGRGTMAITNGLNCIHKLRETRNYLFVRVRAAFYTVLLIIAIVLSLLLLGFGNSISLLVNEYVPVFQYVTDFIIEIRTISILCVLMVFSICVYRFLPNRHGKLKYQIPGAIFTAFGWTLASFFISVYIDIFKGFSNMYGSLTTIVLIMLWFYFCMYILLIGGEINVLVEEKFGE
jgi:membrane protein